MGGIIHWQSIVAMKKQVHYFTFILIASTLLFGWGCEQGDPVFNGRDGDILTFAGRDWTIKHRDSVLMGPGPNFFSDHPNDVWVDDDGFLHLTITQRDGSWHATEVVSVESMGYGTYTWTIQGDMLDIDPQVVLGLFTWDNYTFQEEANSEVDIEFSKWGEDLDTTTLQYGVQPIAFGPYNAERAYKPQGDSLYTAGISTHEFTWTDTLITWRSWAGEYSQNPEILGYWEFDDSNPARIKYEGPNVSDPIVIPGPGDSTNARMNYWLLTGPTAGPDNGRRHEVIIRDFIYQPL